MSGHVEGVNYVEEETDLERDLSVPCLTDFPEIFAGCGNMLWADFLG